MVSCHIIVNFKKSELEKLSKEIQLSDYEIFTDDVSIKQKCRDCGYKSEWIEEFFGFANDRIYSIYDKAISQMNVVESKTKDISYREVNLISGLRFDIMNRFVLLDQARQILSYKKNVLFLFSSLQYQYFSIIEIAKEMGYDIGFGVAEFSDSEIKRLEFSKSAARDYGYLYQKSEELFPYGEQSEFLDYTSSLITKIEKHKKYKHAFFLTDNTWELYLKPIFPILEEFRKTKMPFVIFTLDSEATKHLQDKGYDVYDLSGEIYNILYKVLSRIYHISEDEIEEIRSKIYLEYSEEITKIVKNISLLEQDLGLKKDVKVELLPQKAAKKVKKERKIQNKLTYLEKIYYFIANKHYKYSRYFLVRAIGKATKPLFLKLEERAKAKMKLRELELKKETDRLKTIQLEKEQQITNEIRVLEARLNKEISEKETELLKLRIQLLEIELEKETRIRKIFAKTPVTFHQKKINELIRIVLQISFDKDSIIEHFCRYFPNDTNVLYLARNIASISLFDRIFRWFEFKSILVSSGGSPDIDMVCNVARKYNIPNYLMTIHPYEEYVPIHKVILNADKLLLAGDRLKQELEFLGIDKNRLVITGNPKFDILNKKMEMKKTSASKGSVTITKKPLIIVANSRWNDGDDMWMSDLIQYCNNNNLEILIKVHPTYKHWKQELNDMMIQKIREKCTGLKYEIKIDADLHTLLSQASVLITEFSWMGFEGSLFDVPLIVTNFQGKNYSDYALLYHKEGIALYATTLTELFDCLNKILNDDQTQEKLREARKKLNYDFNYLNDGKAAERVFKILTKEA